MTYEPKGIEPIELTTIAMDLNGTLTVYGEVEEGIKEEIKKLRDLGFELYLLTGDQRGTAAVLAEEIGIHLHKASTADEKEEFTKL